MKTIRLKYLMICLLCVTTAMAQTKKLEKSFKANKDVTVNIDAKHTNLIVDYWDRNEVQVLATLESSGTDKKVLDEALEDWKLETKGTANEIFIKSTGGAGFNGSFNMTSLEEPLSKLPEILAPLQQMMGPLLESISSNPLPPEFYANMGDLNFDYEAYKKEGDAYLEKFEKKVEKNFGKDFEKSMEEWAANLKKDTTIWKNKVVVMEGFGKDFEKSMEAWGEEFGKEMEKWGEQFGKEMESWAANVEKEVEKRYGDKEGEAIIINDKTTDQKKVLRVKIPRNGQLKLNVRYGDVKLNGNTSNLKADLSHSKFSANTISGNKTDVKVAYTPVRIKQWNYGVLNASYVQNLTIDRVVSIKIDSNSSDVNINKVVKNGIFNGSFGELIVREIDPDFEQLDITLENSDLKLDLPEVAYNFDYSGTKSQVKFPEGLNLKSNKSYDNQKLKGFNKNKNSDASIRINANFSDVLLK